MLDPIAPSAPVGSEDTAQKVDFDSLKEVKDIDQNLDVLEKKDFEFYEEEKPAVVEPPKTDTVTPPETKKEEVAEPPKVETPEAPPVEETPKSDTEFILSEDRLSKLNDEQRKYLSKYKDKSLPELLDALANAQKLVGKKGFDETRPLFSELSPETPETQLPPKVDDDTEALKAKDTYVQEELRRKYPEMPLDAEERKAWIRNLNIDDPEKWDQYKEDKKSISQEVDQIFTKTKQLRDNYPTINKNIINTEVKNISNYFTNELKIDPKELGYNFEFDKDGENQLVNELLLNDQGVIDPALVEYYNKIPIVKQDALMVKFFRKNLPKIKSAIEVKARTQGYETASDKKKPAPTLGLSKSGDQKIKEDITLSTIPSLDIKEIDKYLDQLENS